MMEEALSQREGQELNADKVIGRLTQQIGGLHLELAMRDTYIEELQEKVRELQQVIDTVALDKEVKSNGKQERAASKSG